MLVPIQLGELPVKLDKIADARAKAPPYFVTPDHPVHLCPRAGGAYEKSGIYLPVAVKVRKDPCLSVIAFHITAPPIE